MDREGVERAALINYVAPEVMGFDASTNDWVSRYVSGHEDRLVAVGSVHPRHSRDPGGDAERLFDEKKIRILKIHPPHQVFAANAYNDGLEGLAKIYAAAQARRRPVMIHTGTSIFPGARNRYADPMAADDVAVDFPQLPLILAHAGRPLYMETAVFLVRRHPNVHLDLSGIPPEEAAGIPAASGGALGALPLGNRLPQPGHPLDAQEPRGLFGVAAVGGGEGADSLEQRGRADQVVGVGS